MDQEPSNRSDSAEAPQAVPLPTQEPDPSPAAPAEPLRSEAAAISPAPDPVPSASPVAAESPIFPPAAAQAEVPPPLPAAEPEGAAGAVPDFPAAPPAVGAANSPLDAISEEGRVPVSPIAALTDHPIGASSVPAPMVGAAEAWPEARQERGALPQADRTDQDDYAQDAPHGGPNWMLAFVCAWAGGTALNEAWASTAAGKVGAQLLRNPAFAGYLLLGLGLVAFAIEALRWGKRNRGMASLLIVVVPALLTLAGVACLVLSTEPGRRI